MPLLRDGVDLPGLRQGGGDAELDVSHECLDCGEPRVTSGGTIAALFLEVREEVEHQRDVDVLETEL